VEIKENNDKNPEKKQKKHKNRSAIFIMVGLYYFDPGVGDLYCGGICLNTM